MSELRTDRLTGRQSIVAGERAARPNDFRHAAASPVVASDYRADCPFCAGNETHTPEAIAQWPADGPWQIRVVPNKYPAVPRQATDAWQGWHEVLVESPRHVLRPAQLSVDERAAVLARYAERLAAASAAGGLPYRLVFQNVGPDGGASLEHLHSQFVALPVVPQAVTDQAAREHEHYQLHGSCGWCDRVADELAAGERLVACTPRFVAYCPAVSRQAGEVAIVPRDHDSTWERLRLDAELRLELAEIQHQVLTQLEAILPGVGLNLLVVTPPESAGPQPDHWRIEIVPRTAHWAGLEIASHTYLVTVPPETAASQLRAAHYEPYNGRIAHGT